MSTRVNTALAEVEALAAQECPGWEIWPIGHHDKRVSWSARPAGAPVAVITDAVSADDLVKTVRHYEQHLGAHLEAAKRQLANAPTTGIGRDRAAVLAALVPALEALQAARHAEAAEGHVV